MVDGVDPRSQGGRGRARPHCGVLPAALRGRSDRRQWKAPHETRRMVNQIEIAATPETIWQPPPPLSPASRWGGCGKVEKGISFQLFPVDDLPLFAHHGSRNPTTSDFSRPASKRQRSGVPSACQDLSDFQEFVSELIDPRAYFGHDSRDRTLSAPSPTPAPPCVPGLPASRWCGCGKVEKRDFLSINYYGSKETNNQAGIL